MSLSWALMRREELNMFLDGLLSLSPDQSKDSRKLLIELASVSGSYSELLAEWLSFHDFWKDKILEIKTWMGLSYFQLMTLFNCSHREVGRILSAKRSQQLPPYPAKTLSSTAPPRQDDEIEGISCFMVEQHLSSWIDGEWETYSEVSKIQKHLDACPACRQRLQDYRSLHQVVLKQRRSYEAVSEREWRATLEELQRLKVRRRFRYILSFSFIILVVVGIFYLVEAQPEKMPNIYEIENTETSAE